MSVESYLATMARMIQWAIRDVNNLVSRVDMSDPDGARDALKAEMPTLIAVWGEIAATQAAEYFEELIDAPAVLAEPVDDAAIDSMVGWAIGPAYGVDNGDGTVTPPDPGKARRNLQGGAQRHILNAGRDTIKQSAGNTDGVAWMRVLRGETNCAFCLVMASRGPVYDSAESAGAQSVSSDDPRIQLGDRYHSACDCAVVAVRDERDYPEGHDPEALYDMYMAARRNADQMTIKGGENNILTQVRKMYGMH